MKHILMTILLGVLFLISVKQSFSQRTIEEKGAIVVVGTAFNDKQGASVWLKKGGVYYIEDKLKWSSKELGKKVKVKGRLYIDRIVIDETKGLIADMPVMYVIDAEKIKIRSFGKTKLYKKNNPAWRNDRYE